MIRALHPRSTLLAGAAILALAAAPAPAPAQQRLTTAAAPSAAITAAVGHWLYDDRGEIVGSVKSVSADGRTATIVLGVYTLDDVRVVEVPVDVLSVVDGRVTLRTETAQALLSASSRRG